MRGAEPTSAAAKPVASSLRELSLNATSKAWAQVADDLRVGDVTLHGLRHTHASQLIDAGVDIVTISKRLGHASPAITMKVYAHLFQQSEAADAINAALAGLKQK